MAKITNVEKDIMCIFKCDLKHARKIIRDDEKKFKIWYAKNCLPYAVEYYERKKNYRMVEKLKKGLR